MHLPRKNKMTTVTLATSSRNPESCHKDLQALTAQKTVA